MVLAIADSTATPTVWVQVHVVARERVSALADFPFAAAVPRVRGQPGRLECRVERAEGGDDRSQAGSGLEEKAYWVKGYGWRFPIVDREDLKVAIASLGLIPLELMPQARKFISRRARELMLGNLLPESWPDN
jgi:hypothetical protein